MAKDPWRVILELEVVFGGRGKLVTGSARRLAWATTKEHRSARRMETEL